MMIQNTVERGWLTRRRVFNLCVANDRDGIEQNVFSIGRMIFTRCVANRKGWYLPDVWPIGKDGI